MIYYFIILLFLKFQPGNEIESISPHGDNLQIDCGKCHNSTNWIYNPKESKFDHSTTNFTLLGQHKELDCRLCHKSLKFEEVANSCNKCHNDVHNQTLGNDCGRCHTPELWIISDVSLIHERGSFPLTGVHTELQCNECHKNESNLIFEPLGIDCYDCHKEDYLSAKSPDHVGQSFSTDCVVCHSSQSKEWNTDKILHSFFPLEKAHDIQDCTRCHSNGNYKDLSADCISCHENDLKKANNPDHSGFPLECNFCHSLDLNWSPADFSSHDKDFPIYSGKHKDEWDNCSDCHTIQGDFTVFNCIVCHSRAHHQNQGNAGCYNCHPKGK